MVSDAKINWYLVITTIVFVLLTGWWLAQPYIQSIYSQRFFGDFPSIYAVMALLGAIFGIKISKNWGGTQSLIGKALIMFSLGLLAQVFGQLAYAYYSFFMKIEVPYPSLGDAGYFGSIPLYIVGTWYLAKASGVSVSLKSFRNKIQALLFPLLMLGLSYYFFLKQYEFDWSKSITILFDFGYPFGQAIYISIALLIVYLTRSILGGVMRNRVLFILFALVVQYSADFTFLYQVSRGIWKVGEINDYMYLVAYVLMTLALIEFNVAKVKSKL